jgi:hypothetical protein
VRVRVCCVVSCARVCVHASRGAVPLWRLSHTVTNAERDPHHNRDTHSDEVCGVRYVSLR